MKRKFSPKFLRDCVRNFRRCVCSLRHAMWSACGKSEHSSRLYRCGSVWRAKRRITAKRKLIACFSIQLVTFDRWYSIATVVFIGKSMSAHGGQNPVEPIMAGKPVVFGPHMENFVTLAGTLVSKEGAIQVHDVESLERTIENLLGDTEARHRLVRNAREVLDQHRGATARAAALIANLHSGQML